MSVHLSTFQAINFGGKRDKKSPLNVLYNIFKWQNGDISVIKKKLELSVGF
jgi:hypothetical protein